MAIYKAIKKFPRDESYGITSHIRHSCASIPSSIAEASGRGGRAAFSRILQVAMCSASELEYHILLAHHLNLLEDAEYKALEFQAVELKRMLSSFILKVRN